MKRLFFCLICLISTTCLLGCKGIVRYQDEDFKFSRKGWMNEDWIHLDGLTSIGETKTTLVIPDEYEGYKVIIHRNVIMAHFVNIKNDNLKKIYLSSGIENSSNLCTHSNVEIIIVSNTISSFPRDGIIFVTKEVYDKNQEKQYKESALIPANLTYNYNYDNSPNGGYYWIDDYDNELIEFIPKDPIKEGYTFGGWYKEIECIHEWNFDNDLIPQKIYNNNGDYEYKETVLYAKWSKE